MHLFFFLETEPSPHSTVTTFLLLLLVTFTVIGWFASTDALLTVTLASAGIATAIEVAPSADVIAKTRPRDKIRFFNIGPIVLMHLIRALPEPLNAPKPTLDGSVFIRVNSRKVARNLAHVTCPEQMPLSDARVRHSPRIGELSWRKSKLHHRANRTA